MKTRKKVRRKQKKKKKERERERERKGNHTFNTPHSLIKNSMRTWFVTLQLTPYEYLPSFLPSCLSWLCVFIWHCSIDVYIHIYIYMCMYMYMYMYRVPLKHNCHGWFQKVCINQIITNAPKNFFRNRLCDMPWVMSWVGS